MATAAAIGPTGPRIHQPRGGGARLTRTLVIVAGVAIATAMFVMIVALHSDSPDSSQAVRSDDAATVTSNEERAAIAELEAKARSQKPADIKSVPLPPPSPTLTTQAPAVPLPPRPPSRLAELREEEYVKALSAPPMVEAFHHPARRWKFQASRVRQGQPGRMRSDDHAIWPEQRRQCDRERQTGGVSVSDHSRQRYSGGAD